MCECVREMAWNIDRRAHAHRLVDKPASSCLGQGPGGACSGLRMIRRNSSRASAVLGFWWPSICTLWAFCDLFGGSPKNPLGAARHKLRAISSVHFLPGWSPPVCARLEGATGGAARGADVSAAAAGLRWTGATRHTLPLCCVHCAQRAAGMLRAAGASGACGVGREGRRPLPELDKAQSATSLLVPAVRDLGIVT